VSAVPSETPATLDVTEFLPRGDYIVVTMRVKE
jgi:hypothetical protein